VCRETVEHANQWGHWGGRKCSFERGWKRLKEREKNPTINCLLLYQPFPKQMKAIDFY
jgi:hypothetical protein